MRFGSWYPLSAAGDHSPEVEGILQVRLSTGLLDYPRGKSAMVWYGHVPNVRAAALALAGAHVTRPHGDLVARHLIEIEVATDLGVFCAKLRADFVRRFGAPPQYETP